MSAKGGCLSGFALAILLVAAALDYQAATVDEKTETAARRVHLRIESSHAGGPELVDLHVEPVSQETDEKDGLVRTVDLTDGSAELDLPLNHEKAFRIRATAPDHWSRPILIDEASSRERAVILWPAAELKAELELPDRRDRPRETRIRLSPVSGLDDTLAALQPEQPAEITCPVTEKTAVSCSVPVGRWNLRLVAAPFAPELFWNLRVDAEEGLELGTVKLRRGGSLVGRLTTEEGPVDPRRARVELRPLRAGEPDDPSLEEELRQLDRLAETGADGSFHLVGVTPGLYEVRASHRGFVSASRAPVKVEGGSLSELTEPLILELPLRLSLSIEPVTEPSGRPWGLEVYRWPKHGEVRFAAEAETDAVGSWESPPLPAGSYRIRLLDAKGDTRVERELELDRASREAHIEVPLVYVEGEVRLGDEPLKAQIWFGGQTGNVSVETESDKAGEFFAVLPREGEWTVDVHADSPVVRSRNLRVDVEPMEGMALAEVEIEVPATSLQGCVVNEVGGPPGATARIILLRQDGEAALTGIETDALGEFEIGGMLTGTYTVTAETAEASSSAVTVHLGEGATESVTLALRPQGEMVGTVMSRSGPVPGASVRVYFVTGTGQGIRMKIEHRHTSATGTFAVPLPGDAMAARVVTMAPGFALNVQRVPASREAQIVLDRSAGHLSLLDVGQGLWAREDSSVGLLLIDGEPVDLPRILKWARVNGGDLTQHGTLAVPWMPVGQYALCHLTIQEALFVLDGAALPTVRACIQGFLAPGGELTLALPPQSE